MKNKLNFLSHKYQNHILYHLVRYWLNLFIIKII